MRSRKPRLRSGRMTSREEVCAALDLGQAQPEEEPSSIFRRSTSARTRTAAANTSPAPVASSSSDSRRGLPEAEGLCGHAARYRAEGLGEVIALRHEYRALIDAASQDLPGDGLVRLAMRVMSTL